MSLRSWKPCPFLSVLKFPNCLLDISAWMHKQPQTLPRTQFLISHHKLFFLQVSHRWKAENFASFLISVSPAPPPHLIHKHILSALPPQYISNLSISSVYRPPSLIQAINLSPEWLQQPCQLLSLSSCFILPWPIPFFLHIQLEWSL